MTEGQTEGRPVAPSPETSESERSPAQSLTHLDSSPWHTPCLKNAPLQRAAVQEVPRAASLELSAGHALCMPWHATLGSSTPQLREEPTSESKGRFVFAHTHMQPFKGFPPTLPVKLVLKLGMCKALGTEGGLTTKALRGGRWQNCSIPDGGGVT